MIGHMGSHEWRSDYHPADRINELEARVKELETALESICSVAEKYSGDYPTQVATIAMAALKKEKP